MIICFHNTSIGRIGIAEQGGAITNLYLKSDAVPVAAKSGNTELLREAFSQLQAYLAGDLSIFDLPFAPSGTTFMEDVWRNVARVTYGSTASYGDIARAVGKPKAVRAVGMANGRNPIPLFIPCHRIVCSDGTPGGYRGGRQLKEWLIELERCRHGMHPADYIHETSFL